MKKEKVSSKNVYDTECDGHQLSFCSSNRINDPFYLAGPVVWETLT